MTRKFKKAHDRCRLTLEALECRALLSTCHVSRLSDSGIGKGFRGDLRYCINKANSEPGPDTIDFNVTGVINLAHALPALVSDIDIQGPGADLLTVRRNAAERFRVFAVPGPANVQIAGLTISNGEIFTGGDEFGGGVYNAGTLTLSACVVTGNTIIAYDNAYGGGIHNAGLLTVIDTTVEGNKLHAFLAAGGGISNTGTAYIHSSTISGNSAGVDSSDNGYGGGISNTGSMFIENSTVASNRTKNGVGGGFYVNAGFTDIDHSTIAANVADEKGGGIYIASNAVHVRNTIIAQNVAETSTSDDVWGTLASSSHNLIGTSAGGGGYSATDILGVDPLLGDLVINGGRTKTFALLPNSPAINAGDNSDAPQWDQRGTGFSRVAGSAIDIGSFEVQTAAAPGAPSLSRPDLLHAVWATIDVDQALGPIPRHSLQESRA